MKVTEEPDATVTLFGLTPADVMVMVAPVAPPPPLVVVPVLPDDTPQTLSDRVLAAEHVIYPRAARWFVEDQLLLRDGRVQLTNAEPQCLFWAG